MKKLSILSSIILIGLLSINNFYAQQVKCNYVQLDGTDDYLLSDTNVTYHTSSYTIETWFKFNAVGSGWKFLASTMSGGSGSRYTYYDYSNQRFVLGYRSGGFQDFLFNYTMDTAWHHIAHVYDQPNAIIKAYIDGVLIDSATTNGAIPDSQPTMMVVGRAPGSPTNVSDCNFEEVRYWSEARSQQQIVNNMNQELLGNEPNLIGYWNMNQNNATFAIDITANGNNLQLVNGNSSTVWENDCVVPVIGGQSTSALEFNGSGGRVIVPGSAAADISEGSYGAWVKFNAFNSTYQRIIYKEANVELFYFEPMKRFEAEIVVGTQRFEVFTDSLTFKIDTATWYHLMVTYDTTDFKIYVNGNLESTNSTPQGPIKSQPNSWGIGASPTSGAWSFNGQIDEVILFNRALNDDEVQSLLCSQISPTDSIYSNLVAYYKFDENSGVSAGDEINANDGTLDGGVNWVVKGMPSFKPEIVTNINNLSSDITGISYQWYLNGSPISAATNQDYDAIISGDYQIEVLSEFGCLGTSDIEPFILTGLESINNELEQLVYPNPTKGIVYISNPMIVKTVSILDLTGKEVLISKGSNSIDISNMQTGFYLIKIVTNENQSKIFKLFKQ